MNYFVVYKNDFPVACYRGEEEACRELGITRATLNFRISPVYKRRSPSGQIVKVSMKEGEVGRLHGNSRA